MIGLWLAQTPIAKFMTREMRTTHLDISPKESTLELYKGGSYEAFALSSGFNVLQFPRRDPTC